MMKFEELYFNLKINELEILLETELSLKLKDVLRKANVEPKEEIDIANFEKLDIKDDSGTLIAIDKKGGIQSQKLGRVIRKFFPNLKPDEIEKAVGEIKAEMGKVDKIQFEISNDVFGWYSKLSCVADSCMISSKSKDVKPFVKFYNDLGKDFVRIVLLKNKKGEIVGRALLWNGKKISGTDGKDYLDRTYPSGNNQINKKFHQLAKEQNWAYRTNNNMLMRGLKKITIDGNSKDRTIGIEIPYKKIKDKIPFLDSFVWGRKGDSFLILSNDATNLEETKGLFGKVINLMKSNGSKITIPKK